MSKLLDLIPGLGWLRILFAPLRWLFAWVTADWRHPIMLGFAVALASHWLILDPQLRSQRDAAIKAEKKALSDLFETIQNYDAAAALAQEAQAANLARVATEQNQITERISDDYENRLGELRARADQLRAVAAASDPGLSGAVSVPATGAAAAGIAQAPGNPGLPAASICPAMNLEERIVASEQALQLDALIGWVIAQAKVRSAPE